VAGRETARPRYGASYAALAREERGGMARRRRAAIPAPVALLLPGRPSRLRRFAMAG